MADRDVGRYKSVEIDIIMRVPVILMGSIAY
jgi:hypothetical protein